VIEQVVIKLTYLEAFFFEIAGKLLIVFPIERRILNSIQNISTSIVGHLSCCLSFCQALALVTNREMRVSKIGFYSIDFVYALLRMDFHYGCQGTARCGSRA
jgi:hypothetical protein